MTDRPPGAIKSLHELEMLAQRNGGEATVYTVGDEYERIVNNNGVWLGHFQFKLTKRWFVPEWAFSKNAPTLLFFKVACPIGGGFTYTGQGRSEYFYGPYAIFSNYWFAVAHLNRWKYDRT